ncbi:ATP-binding protein [Trueperella pecoris]|uniref:ATP-binding protein n=1 Tax=Trueperella pecoris TaxID=2733571 RepID=UPI001ABEA552|nr:ATP-binding protein [Trueperella pecoris]QTG75369.1 ATP-binding protein [Trueperella pecoris]
MTPSGTPQFTFEFSLTVLNHLGRQLYRNFITVLGEAISNAWDADATQVEITIDRETHSMRIEDDGHGMSHDDIQNKFLKIGYSKRKNGDRTTDGGRPFIGAKGIGKLALLSCADSVSVISRKGGGGVDGCVIDNIRIDQAIDEDKSSQHVALASPSGEDLASFTSPHGTILTFTNVRMPNSTDPFLRKALALFFRFSLVDDDFTIIFNGKPITLTDAQDLALSTQYVWTLGEFTDPFLKLINAPANRTAAFTPPQELSSLDGFLATVKKPADLRVFGASEKIGVDLFVNGRLRERNILRHRPSARVPAQYLYGQIHLNQLDDGTAPEPFTSSREGVLDNNELFVQLLNYLESILPKLFDQWDEWRLADKQEGDADNTKRKSKSARAADKLGNEKKEELFGLMKKSAQFETMLNHASADVGRAAEEYTALFILENLLREVLTKYQMSLNSRARKELKGYREEDDKHFKASGFEAQCRKNTKDPWFVGLEHLLNSVQSQRSQRTNADMFDRHRPGIVYLRNIVMHTAGLTHFGHEKLFAYQSTLASLIQSIVASEEHNRQNQTSRNNK